MSDITFRDYLIPAGSARLREARGLDPLSYARRMLDLPRIAAWDKRWQQLYAAPFRGVTVDGQVTPNLFQLADQLADEAFDVGPAVRAAETLVAGLSSTQQEAVRHAVDAHEWRAWYNPEIPFNTYGVRLDQTSSETLAAFLDLLRASVSPAGYKKVIRCMSSNLYLGEIYGLRNIMNERSYQFLLFGKPSVSAPWGWSIYGHHVALNCLFIGRQMVITPTFLGGEPNVIDRGARDSFVLFNEEETGGLELMRMLSDQHSRRATIYKMMNDPAMPEDRLDPDDQRHLAGAFQDNRIIPYEGVPAIEFSPEQRAKLMQVIGTFIEYLPDGPRTARLRQIASFLDETYWSWIGGHGDEDRFYYRIQSPVILIEFDHHSGVWLTNTEPAKFHIHTIVRTPNGNDYGKDLLNQYRSRLASGRGAGA